MSSPPHPARHKSKLLEQMRDQLPSSPQSALHRKAYLHWALDYSGFSSDSKGNGCTPAS